MTASTPPIAQPAAFGPAGPAAAGGKGAAAGGPLAGFEALLAALFPQQGAPGGPAGSTIASADAIRLEDTPEGETSDGDASAASADILPADGSEATTLAAALFVPAPATATAAPPTTSGADPGVARNERGADAPAGFVEAQPPEGILPDDEVAPAAADAAQDLPEPPQGQAVPTQARSARAEAAPPAFGREKPAGVPAQPALENASPKAELAAKAATSDGVEAASQTPPAETPEAVQTAQAARGAPQLAPAPRAESAPKASKSERKGVADAADALKPRGAADRPVHAKAAESAAKTAAAAAPAEVSDLKVRDEKPAADQPDSALQGETRATGASQGPAAHAAHAVRGAPETVANLAAQIVKKLEARSTRFDLELDPAGLGKVDVRVEIGAQGKLTAAMLFDNPQAAHELKARAVELQRALEQAGFDLSGGLSFEWADNGRHQGQAWQEPGDGGRAFRGQAFRAALETAGEADVAPPGALRLRRGLSAGVDVRI